MRNNNIKVTYILFCYNQSRYIEAAVESAINQTYPNIDYIISDDCSNDDTFEKILNTLKDTKKNIKINRNKINLGIAGHFNLLMSWATGCLVVVAAGDDISEKNRVEKLVEIWISNGKPPLIGSSISLINDLGSSISNNPLPQYIYEHDKFTNLNAKKLLEMHLHSTVAGCSLAYSRSLINKFPNFDERIQSEDVVWIFRAYLLADIFVTSAKLVKYRIHSDSYSENNTITSDDQRKISKKYGSFYYKILFRQHLTDTRLIYQKTGDTKLLDVINLLEVIVYKQEILDKLNKIKRYHLRVLSSTAYFICGELNMKDYVKILLNRKPPKFHI